MSHSPSHDGHGACGPSGTHSHHDEATIAASDGRAVALSLTLNGGFVALCLLAGWSADSNALLGEGVHNLGDVLGLGLAYLGVRTRLAPPSARFGWGLGRASIVAALFNGLLLVATLGVVTIEAVAGLLAAPREVAAHTVVWVSAAGIVINGASAALLARGRAHDLNLRAAFLHQLADATISAGIAGAGALTWVTGASKIDDLAALGLALWLLPSAVAVVWASLRMVLDETPARFRAAEVRARWPELVPDASLAQLRARPLSTTQVSALAVVRPRADASLPGLVRRVRALLRAHGADHVVVELELELELAPLGARAEAAPLSRHGGPAEPTSGPALGDRSA